MASLSRSFLINSRTSSEDWSKSQSAFTDIGLIGGHLASNKTEHYWALIGWASSMFGFNSFFTLMGCAHTLEPISLIGGSLHAWQVFSSLASNPVAFSQLLTSAHFPMGEAYMLGGLQVLVTNGHAWFGPHSNWTTEATMHLTPLPSGQELGYIPGSHV